MKAKRLIFVLLLIMSLIMLAGCKKTYIFDFAAKQSLGSGDDHWGSHTPPGDVGYEFLPNGLRLFYTSISSTVTFSGNFSLEYDFDLLDADSNLLNWLDLMITDTHEDLGFLTYDLSFGIGFKDPGQSSGYYYYGQNDAWVEEEGLPEKFNLYGANKVKITKTGNKIRIDINGSKLGEFSLLPANERPFYRVFAMADYTGSEDSAGILLHKVTVNYDEGTLEFIPLFPVP